MHEVAIPAGMVAWAGGDSAPEDWDGGPVLLEQVSPGSDPVGYRWTGQPITSAFRWNNANRPHVHVIAYTPRTPTPASEDAAGWQRIESSGDEVTDRLRTALFHSESDMTTELSCRVASGLVELAEDFGISIALHSPASLPTIEASAGREAMEAKAIEIFAAAFDRAGDLHAAASVRGRKAAQAARVCHGVPLHMDVSIDAICAALATPRPSAPGEGMREARSLVPHGEPVPLNDCPPGPFEFNGSLGYRSEYATTLEGSRRHQVDAYCFESGEYFWGGAKGTDARGKLIVQPLALTAGGSR